MPVKIKVKFFAQMAITTGCRECIIEVPENFFKALEVIESQFNLTLKDKLGSHYSVLVNGKGFSYGLKSDNQLKDNDILAFVPFLGGG